MVSTVLRGGLGNQLFQIAQVVAHSLRHDIPYFLPQKAEHPHSAFPAVYRFASLNYEQWSGTLAEYKELSFEYVPIPRVDNVCFNGYWQSFKYFEDFNDEIIRMLRFRWQMENGVCAVHVRRGDYLKLADFHPFVGEEYLFHAMYLIGKTTGIHHFRFISNDIPWCKQIFKEKDLYEYSFVETGSPINDMEIGSGCEHQILSNSTFSLWMHHLNLNPDKICIAPHRWFGPKQPHNTKDLYPKTAIII